SNERIKETVCWHRSRELARARSWGSLRLGPGVCCDWPTVLLWPLKARLLSGGVHMSEPCIPYQQLPGHSAMGHGDQTRRPTATATFAAPPRLPVHPCPALPRVPLHFAGAIWALFLLTTNAPAQERAVLAEYSDMIRFLAFSPDGKFLASVSGNQFQVHER